MVLHQFWFGRLYHKMFPSSALKSPTCYVPPRHLTLITLAPWTSLLSLTTSLSILPPPPHPMVLLIYPLKSTRDLQLTSNCQNKEHCPSAYLNLAGFYTTDLSPFGNSLFLWLPFCPPASAISLDSCIPFQSFHEHLSQCLKCLTCCSFSGLACPAGLSAPSAGFPWTISYSRRSHLDIWCQAPWISSPDLSPLALQLSGGPLNLYVLLLPEILQYRVTALEPSKTWS